MPWKAILPLRGTWAIAVGKFIADPIWWFYLFWGAKFLNEKDSSKVRDAVMKYEIKHPVINDDRMLVWKSYERRSWPSQVLLSPKNQMPILILHGEGMRQVLDLFLSVAYDFYFDGLNHKRTFELKPEESK